ncbi:hypothetical protein [Ruixingdingia sedimenti]|uniref:Uncharacterized protein n=1 Tax=Ruixingdingia sedimenti TaxID=3073604 RepID=A0ABU1FEP1_9RHOB|nr:hypothetical protein [Xinfangfangia sp. LG-4]MDR5655365.1 hypothetical protein [Xinfangfangia sp. LG-4]
MAYSFPLSLADFWDILPIRELTFDLPEAVEISETGGGEILTADLGTRLWQGEVVLGDMTPDEAADVSAMLDIVRRAGGSFFATDRARPWPRSDWGGSVLGAASVTMHSVAGTSREMRLQGLPVGYQLRRGDRLAYSYGTNPVRYALHRVASPATADEAGVTPLFEVSPNLRPGWPDLAAVTLVKPACKAVIVPGSVQPGRRRARLTVGSSFRFQQTLR